MGKDKGAMEGEIEVRGEGLEYTRPDDTVSFFLLFFSRKTVSGFESFQLIVKLKICYKKLFKIYMRNTLTIGRKISLQFNFSHFKLFFFFVFHFKCLSGTEYKIRFS